MADLLVLYIEGSRGAYRVHRRGCSVLKNPRRYWPARRKSDVSATQFVDCKRCGGAAYDESEKDAT